MLTLVKRNPRINQLELSKQLGISLTTIKRTMTNLVAKNILERKGGKRYGRWEVHR
jgi:predicted HTH transcriptional regulator